MNEILFGDCREIMRRWAEHGVKAQMCVTSPPYYGLRSYLPNEHPDKALEIGLEETPDEYVARMVDVFRAVRDVLAREAKERKAADKAAEEQAAKQQEQLI